MERTISMMMGDGSINHNNRKFIADNVDRDRVKDNVVVVNQNLKKVYYELFDESLKKYNEKQKRKDRQIKDYYEHVRHDKQLKQFYEVIVQVGNKDDMACGTEEGDLAKEILLRRRKKLVPFPWHDMVSDGINWAPAKSIYPYWNIKSRNGQKRCNS